MFIPLKCALLLLSMENSSCSTGRLAKISRSGLMVKGGVQRSSTVSPKVLEPNFREWRVSVSGICVIGGLSQRPALSRRFCNSLLQNCRGATSLRVLDWIKDRPTRECYLKAVLENGRGQNVLVHNISTHLQERWSEFSLTGRATRIV